MQIEISADGLSATVGEEKLAVGGPITFKNIDNKWVPGIILELRVVDKKVLASPWCYAKDLKTNNANWFSLELWAQNRPSAQPAPTTTPVTQEMIRQENITVEPVNNELNDDDII